MDMFKTLIAMNAESLFGTDITEMCHIYTMDDIELTACKAMKAAGYDCREVGWIVIRDDENVMIVKSADERLYKSHSVYPREVLDGLLDTIKYKKDKDTFNV